MQNDAKMHHKSARNDHEKTQIPMLQCSKTHAVDRAANLHENAFIFVVTVLRCSKNEFQNHPKSSRIYPKCPPRGGPIRSVLPQYNYSNRLRPQEQSVSSTHCFARLPLCTRVWAQVGATIAPEMGTTAFKAVYRRAALQWHPDRDTGNTSTFQVLQNCESFLECCAPLPGRICK